MTIATVTFDPDGWDNYSYNGSIVSGGNPGNCVRGQKGHTVSVTLNLPSPSYIKAVRFTPKKADCGIGTYFTGTAQIRLNKALGYGSNIYVFPDGISWSGYNLNWVNVEKNIYEDTEIDGTHVTSVTFIMGWSFVSSQACYYIDNCEVDFLPGALLSPDNTGRSDCQMDAYTGISSFGNPINVRTGEKLESITDLTIQTPNRTLDLVRIYRQSLQNKFDFMGLGWTHNHHIMLDDADSNRIVVRLSSAGEGIFTDPIIDGDVTNYKAASGVSSQLQKNNLSGEYDLTTTDKQVYHFNALGLLETRNWNNGDIWQYTYNDGKLTTVEDISYSLDGVDFRRKLVFRYYDTGDHVGQLYRVGDHTFDDTNPSQATGRYIEYSYQRDYVEDNGVVINGSKSLLGQVRDVRAEGGNLNNLWEYVYYGEIDHPELLNFLVESHSPEVDTTGDNTNNTSIILQRNSYIVDNGILSSIIQERGIQGGQGALLSTTYTFQPNGENVTQETLSGQTITHHFQGEYYSGSENALSYMSQMVSNDVYRPEIQQDANGNLTALSWSADGKQLESVTDAIGNPTSFNYDTEGRLSFTLDAQGRKTTYTYSVTSRQPSVIQIYESDGVTLLSQQEFDYDSSERVIAERQIDPADGTTILSQTTRTYYESGNGAGLLEKVKQYDTADLINPDSTTTYTYDVLGRVIKVARSSLFGTCQFTNTVYDPASNVLASACGLTNVTPPTTVQEAIALYDANDSQKQHTRVMVHEYDNLGRRIKTISNAGTAWERTSLTVYDALDRVIRTIQNYVADAGIPNPYLADRSLFSHGVLGDENRISETVYNERGQVRKQVDALDNATLYGYDDAGRLVKTVVSASLAAYDNTYSTGDPDLSDYGPVSPADDEDLITEQAYDPVGNLVMSVDPAGRTTYTVYDALNRPVKVVANAKPEATLNPVDEADAAINDPRRDTYVPSEDPDQDHISETTYDALGRVICTCHLVDVRGVTDQWETTLFGYNTLGQQVRTIRFAATPDYDVASDPQLAGYPTSPDADVDLVTETVFDPAGRVMYAQDITGQRNWTAYDGLGRAVKQIRNAVGVADNEADDPRSGSYIPSANPDEDLITLTTYNGDGQVIDTYDALGRVTTRVYDLVGRQSRMVRNHILQSKDPMNWVWSETNHRWELSETDSTPVERSSDPINQPDNHDINLVSETSYDEQGRAIEQWDHLRRCQRTVFDTSGRVVMTIRNYVPNSQPPENWAWSTGNARWEDGNGTAINHGLDEDRNQISTTRFDADGRVSAVRDTAGRETRYTYDRLGRRVATIANYVDGVFDPAAPDEDLITQTVYDKSGQVIATIDSRGTKTTFEYDDAGRRVLVIRDAEGALESRTYTCYDKAGKVLRTIANYQPTSAGESVPADVFGNILPDAWDENGEWYWQPDETLSDAQIVTQYIYDSAGRRIAAIDPLGNTTQTMYGKDGQVQQTMDAENVTTAYRYDLARRRTMVVQNYTGGQPTDIDTWSWNDQSEAWEGNQS